MFVRHRTFLHLTLVTETTHKANTVTDEVLVGRCQMKSKQKSYYRKDAWGQTLSRKRE